MRWTVFIVEYGASIQFIGEQSYIRAERDSAGDAVPQWDGVCTLGWSIPAVKLRDRLLACHDLANLIWQSCSDPLSGGNGRRPCLRRTRSMVTCPDRGSIV